MPLYNSDFSTRQEHSDACKQRMLEFEMWKEMAKAHLAAIKI